MNVTPGRINTALHSLLATAGTALLADAVTRLHAAAQASGVAGGLAAIAVAAISWAQHSRQVQQLAHQVELEAGKIATPAVFARVQQVEQQLAPVVEAAAKVPAVEKLAGEVESRVSDLENRLPFVKVAADDIRPVVLGVLAELANHAPAPVQPASTSDTPPPASPTPEAPAA